MDSPQETTAEEREELATEKTAQLPTARRSSQRRASGRRFHWKCSRSAVSFAPVADAQYPNGFAVQLKTDAVVADA